MRCQKEAIFARWMDRYFIRALFVVIGCCFLVVSSSDTFVGNQIRTSQGLMIYKDTEYLQSASSCEGPIYYPSNDLS